MKKLLLLLALLFSQATSAADANQVVDKFFSYLERQQYERAIVNSFLDTYRTMGLVQDYDSVKSEMAALISQFEVVGNSYGRYSGYDLIVEKKLGERYKRAKYILYFSNEPVELTLALYAPKGKWGIRNIAINTYLADEFEKHFETIYE